MNANIPVTPNCNMPSNRVSFFLVSFPVTIMKLVYNSAPIIHKRSPRCIVNECFNVNNAIPVKINSKPIKICNEGNRRTNKQLINGTKITVRLTRNPALEAEIILTPKVINNIPNIREDIKTFFETNNKRL